MSAGRALHLVIEGETHARLRLELQPALDVINGGGAFSEAIELLRFFDRSVIAILQAGERTGTLREALHIAIQHIESRRASWKVLGAAMGWLSLDISTAVSFVFGLQFGLLPRLARDGISTDNPAQVAQFEQALHTASMLNGALLALLILASVIVAVAVFLYIFGRGTVQQILDRFIARLPILRAVLYDGALADSLAIAGRMLGGGVVFNLAATTAGQATFIPAVRQMWAWARERVGYGDGISRALNTGLLHHAEILILEAHQNASQLSRVMLEISKAREASHKQGTRRFIRWITIITILFSVVTVLIGIWVLWVQNQGLMASVNGIGYGGF